MLDAQKWDGPDTTDIFDVVLAGGDAAAGAARRAVLARDGTWPTPVREDILLLVSELVTNAVRHADAGPGRPLRIQILRGQRRVLVAVVDRGRGFTAQPTPPSPGSGSGGWGLFLVEQIADRWGVECTTSGTRVWFEIAYEE